MFKHIIFYFAIPLLVMLVLLFVVLAFNTFQNTSIARNDYINSNAEFDEHQLKAAADRLSQAIQIKTRSRDLLGQRGKRTALIFLNFLRSHYPKLHKNLSLTVINEKNFVYHWSAQVKDNSSKPILLLAHYDVVPEQGMHWQYSAFSGQNDSKAIWGRGSLDNKSSLLAMLEAIENLLTQGQRIKRDVYLAFGHDEETGGEQGAKKVARYFSLSGLEFDLILDEGLVVTEGVIDLVHQPIALIGIAEKGLLNLELDLESTGGHASMPGPDTAVGQMSRALLELETHPLPARLSYPVYSMLSRLASEASGINRLVLSNLWLFKPLVINRFKQTPATHAAVNTTIAATQISASNKINVLPASVTANLNIRILPGDTINSVQQYIARTINNPRIKMKIVDGAYEPAPVSVVDSTGYQQIEKTIYQVYPDTLVAPSLVLAATDSRHYQHLSDHIYRFVPLRLTQRDLSRIHGENERILLKDYRTSIQFYQQLLINMAVN